MAVGKKKPEVNFSSKQDQLTGEACGKCMPPTQLNPAITALSRETSLKVATMHIV